MPPLEYRFGRFRLLLTARELWLDDHIVPSQRLVFDCLAYLVEHRDRAVGRDELVAAVWGRVDVAEARINELVLRARRVIGDDGQVQRAIRTLPGFGYRWVIATEALPASPGDAGPPTIEPDANSETITHGSDPDAFAATGVELKPEESPAQEWSPVEPVRHENESTLGRFAHRPWRRAALAVALLLLASAGYLWLQRLRLDAAAIPEPIRTVMVLPLTVEAPREAGWVRLGAMDLIADRLRSAGLPVLASDDVLMALRSLEPKGALVDISQLDRRLGVGMLVQGSALRSPSGWTVALSSIASDGRRRQVEAEHADAITAARQAADRLLIALDHAPPDGGVQRDDDEKFQERLQQAQAAILANDLERTRAILTGLPEPHRGDPRVRFLLAQVDMLAGRLEQARTGYSELLATPGLKADPLLYGRVLIGSATARFRARDFAGALHDFDAAVQALHGRNAARDLGRALNGRGGTHIALQQFDAAAADLGQARIQLQQAGDQPGLAQVDTYFGLLEAQRGRFDLALPHLSKAADTFEAFGIVERTLAALLALFDAQTQLLRWPDAMATSDRQWALREHAADPGLSVVIAARRGRALLAFGRYREAAALLTDVEARYADVRPGAVRYLHDFQANVAAHLGRWGATVEAADRALATWPMEPSSDRRGYLMLLRQRALIAGGRATPELVEQLLPATDTVDVSPVLEIARAEWAAARGDAAGARHAFDTALKTAQDDGIPATIALVAVSYANWLLVGDQLDEASALAGRISPWAEHDYDCALLQVAVLHRHGRREPWAAALRQAQALAGEREIPAALREPPAN